MNVRTTMAACCAAALFAPVPDPAADQADSWGPPRQGVVAGLRIAQPAAEVGDPLVFRVDVHNPGDVEAAFPHMGRVETWRLQFESDAGRLYEYSYFARGGPARPMNLEPGATQSIELPVMQPGVVGRFAPVPGLTELPAGRYRAWAFAPWAVRAAERAQEIAPHPGPGRPADPPPAIVELQRVRPKGRVWDDSTWRKPLVLKSAKDAAEHFEADALADLLRQVDFDRQFVLLFAWRGSGQDRLEAEVAESYPEQITFIHRPGRTRDLRQHARAYALRSNVTWRVR